MSFFFFPKKGWLDSKYLRAVADNAGYDARCFDNPFSSVPFAEI